MNPAVVLLYIASSIVVARCNTTDTSEPTTIVPETTTVISEATTIVSETNTNVSESNSTIESAEPNDKPNNSYLKIKRNQSNDSRNIALGTFGYKQLIRDSNVIVDKSLWIKEVLQHNSKYIVITCPRKWGKSVNLNMLKTFLECAVDANGSVVLPINRSFNYKLFKKGQLMFVRGHKTELDGPFRIASEDELIEKYLGQYPVLYLSFDINSGKNYADLYNRLRYRISDACKEHKYLERVMANLNLNTSADIEARRWAQFNMDLFNRLLHGAERYEKSIKSSLRFLTGLLRQYFKKRIFVLVDNYDVFLKTIMHEKAVSDADANKFILLYRHLLDFGLNNNDNIEKVILTGTMHLCPEFLLSFSNISVFDALNNQWSEYFGFHRPEVEALFQYANISNELAPAAHHRYHGYKMNKNSNTTLYNPWSIVNFLHFKEVENFWEMTWDHDFLNNMLYIKPLRDIFETLLYGGNISVTFNQTRITKYNFFHLKQLIATERDHKLTNSSVDVILAYLCSLGYLTHAGSHYDPVQGLEVTHLRLPTGEVTSEFRKRFIWHYQFNEHISGEEMMYFSQDLAYLILNDNVTAHERLRNSTYSLVANLPLFNGTQLNEQLVHSLIHYASLQIRWKFQFNTVFIRNTTTTPAPDMILFKGDRGAVIKIEFDTSIPQKALDKAKQFQDVFQTFHDIKTVKFIGISISYYKNIDVITEILNNR